MPYIFVTTHAFLLESGLETLRDLPDFEVPLYLTNAYNTVCRPLGILRVRALGADLAGDQIVFDGCDRSVVRAAISTRTGRFDHRAGGLRQGDARSLGGEGYLVAFRGFKVEATAGAGFAPENSPRTVPKTLAHAIELASVTYRADDTPDTHAAALPSGATCIGDQRIFLDPQWVFQLDRFNRQGIVKLTELGA